MSKQKKTPWFAPHIKPVREGEYEVCPCSLSPSFAEDSDAFRLFWDGKKWTKEPSSLQPAYIQNRYWRGLTSPSKEAA